MTELKHIAKKYKVICVTETHFSSKSIEEAEVEIPNFNIFREDRSENSSFGGSVIYVHKSLSVTKLDWFDKSESLAVKITISNKILNVICVYRSPNLTKAQNSKLLNQLRKVPFTAETCENIVMVGDFNLPNTDWSNGIVNCPLDSTDHRFIMQNEYLDLFTTMGLHWYIEDQPTRYKLVEESIQSSILDQVFCNNNNIIGEVNLLSPLGKSDHVCIEIETNLNSNSEYINVKQRKWSKVTEDFVLGRADSIDWLYNSDTTNTSVNEVWSDLNTKIQSIISDVPEVVLKVSRHGDPLEKLPWESSRLARKRKEKDKTWREFDGKPCMESFQTALHKQKEFEKIEFEEKVKHEQKIVKNLKYNCKPLFKYFRSKSKARKNVSTLKNNEGKLSESPAETAEILADFFQSVHSTEEYGPLPQKCYNRVTNNIMQDLVILSGDVRLLLSNLNVGKSMGPDGIHPKILKFLSKNEGFVNAITVLFNKCIKDGKIPEIWKIATVIPLHKKGSIHLPCNYRPVSLTSILCKVYEKFIRKHILDFIKDSINSNQHGFSAGKSTLSNLLESIDIINEYLSDGNCADILYLDFSKAFDSVSHYRLILKMENFGISSTIINVVRDFLADRTMRVRVGGVYSESRNVPSGVPQGSVLGPLLFLIFINDLPENMKSLVKLFADDVKLLVAPGMHHVAQEDLDALSEWEDTWKLRFNVDKCKVLHLGGKNEKFDYKLNNKGLDKITEERDLGVTFVELFTFHNQILSIVSKANQKFGWTMRNVLSRDAYVICRIYKALIRPHIEYCTQAWAPVARHGNWNLILKLEGVQRRVTKVIKSLGDLSYKERLERLNLTTLLERRMRGDLIETFKITKNLSNYGSEFFNISPRTENLLARQISKTKSTKQLDFFSNRVLFYWNKLPAHVKNAASINSFKNRLDKFRIEGKRVNLQGHFWDLSDEIFKRI